MDPLFAVRMREMSRSTSIVLVLGLAWASTTLGQPPESAPPREPPAALDLVSALESVMVEAIAKAERSVVAIARYRDPNNPDTTQAVRGQLPPPTDLPRARIFQLEPDEEPNLSFDFGSGVVIGDAEQILTAYHVVQGAKKLVVRGPGGREFEAEVVGADPRSDLAVIAPRAGLPGDDSAIRIKPLKMGDADQLKKGSFLIALGNPFDSARDGQASASWGILSNVSRKLAPPPTNPGERPQTQLRHLPTLLQLDSKLNLGMSGGAVVNLKGELVGITTAAANPMSFDPQAGYAIPMDIVGRRAVNALKDGREVEYGFLGIGLDQNGSNRIDNVRPGTPAAMGGLFTDDEVVEVGGRPVRDSEDLVLAINRMPVGEPVKIKVDRRGVVAEKMVTLAKLQVVSSIPPIVTNRPEPWRGLRVDYTSAVYGPVDEQVLEKMVKGSVSVADVAPESPSQEAGLRQGQVIVEVDGTPIRTPKQFAQAVQGKRGPVKILTDVGLLTIPAR